MKRMLVGLMLALVGSGPCLRSAAQNVCIESGPYYQPWQCVTAGSHVSGGSITFSNLEVCIGETIVGPTLSSPPVFLNGLMRRYVTHDCPENAPYWLTNSLRYLPGELYFEPPLPTTLTNATTNTYTAKIAAFPTSVLAWWPANEHTNELLYTNNAVLMNGATYAAGMVGSGFSFDGVNDYVTVTNSPYLNLGASNSFSIDLWIKSPSGSASSQYILAKYGNGKGYLFSLSSGKPLLVLYSSTGTGSYWASAAADLRDGNLHHIAITVDRNSASGGKIYVDGVAKLSFNPLNSRGSLNNSAPLRIGTTWSATSGFFKGVIDELTLYQCALSSNEVNAIYSAGSAGKKWNNSPTNGASLPTGCLCGSIAATVGSLTLRAGHWPPVITTPPAAQTVQVGATATFSVSANSCDAPMTYQWRFNGTNLPAATNSSLTLSAVTPANAGDYSVVVSNQTGSVTSADAELTVTCLPPVSNWVAWWQAEGNALDSVGANNGALQGGVIYTNGLVGNAFRFNGSNGRVDIPDVPALRPTNFTMEAWVYPTSLSSGWRTVMLKARNSNGLSFGLYARDGPIIGQPLTLTSGARTFLLLAQPRCH